MHGVAPRRHVLAWLLAPAACATLACVKDKLTPIPTQDEPQGPQSTVRLGDPAMAPQLLTGFHAIEEKSWRWTKSRFSVRLGMPLLEVGENLVFVLQFSLPASLLKHTNEITVSPALNKVGLPSRTYAQEGNQRYEAAVPPQLMRQEQLTATVQVSPYATPGVLDQRELGMIVLSIGLEGRA